MQVIDYFQHPLLLPPNIEIISSKYLFISKAVCHLPYSVLSHKPDGYLRPSMPRTSLAGRCVSDNTIAKRSKVNCSINWILTATSSRRQARTTANEQHHKNCSIPQQQRQPAQPQRTWTPLSVVVVAVVVATKRNRDEFTATNRLISQRFSHV